MSAWDPERAAAYYDELGEGEWTRFEDGRTPRVGEAGLEGHLEERIRRRPRPLALSGCELRRDRLLRRGAQLRARPRPGSGRRARSRYAARRARGDSVAPREVVQEAIASTGFLPERGVDYGHLPMSVYRWPELREMLEPHGEIVASSAAGLLASVDPEEPELRDLLERWEIDLAADPGAISCGQHILAVVRRPT